jgi:hypothetical protein
VQLTRRAGELRRVRAAETATVIVRAFSLANGRRLAVLQ